MEKFKYIENSMANHRIVEEFSDYSESILSIHDRRHTQKSAIENNRRSGNINKSSELPVLEVDEDEESEQSRKYDRKQIKKE